MVQPLAVATLPWRQLFILLFGRWTLNTAFRVVYPLIPFLALSFAIDERTASLLATVQVAATLLSPLGGTLADRRGERETMVWGLGLFCLGTLVCALAGGFALFLVGYGLVGLGTALYHPAGQAYASARTPYAQRGRVLGLLELSWALAALVGVSALTWVVTRTNDRSDVFYILLVFGLAVFTATRLGLPDTQHHAAQGRAGGSRGLRPAALLQPHILGALALVFGMIMATELIFVSYAAWLNQDFGATTEQAGFVLALLGAVELFGSGGSALLVDRFGKRVSVLGGLALSGLAQALLPFSAGNWPLFIVLFLLFGLGFEYSIVSYFPLISEVLPEARGTVLSISVAIIGLGRVVGSLIGPVLWESGGFLASGLLAAAVSLVALIVGLLSMREGSEAGD